MADQSRPGSEFYAPPRKFKDLGDGTYAEVHALDAGSIGGGTGGGLTDAQLRATPVPVTIPTPTPVTDNGGSLTVDGTVAISNPTANPETGLAKDATLTTRLPAALDADGGLKGHIQNFPASQAVTGPLTDTQLRALAVPVSGTVTASGPVTDAQLRATPVPVTIPTPTPVTDNAGSLTVDAPVGTPVWVRQSDGAAALIGNKVMATSLPVTIASDQPAISVQQVPGGTAVAKTGTLTSVAVTADQIVLTYTVTALKTFYMTYLIMYGRLTVAAATATILGAISLENPAGTKLLTLDDMNPTTSELEFNPLVLTTPIPFAAGTVVRVVVTPAAATSMLWRANFGGYEK